MVGFEPSSAIAFGWTTKYGMRFPHPDHASREFQQLLILRLQVPIQPADLVILTVGVVIPLLSVANLIPGQQHGNSLRKQKGGNKVSRLLQAAGIHRRILGWTLSAAVPAPVIIGAVAIIFAIRK